MAENRDTSSGAAAQRMLAVLAERLGEEHVTMSGAHVDADSADRYTDPYALGGVRQSPAGVVRPGSTEEVQEVMRLANEHGVAVWPIGQGRNLGYGGGSPRRGGGVTIDLSRMNRVLQIDDETAVAMIEPGVRFFDLYDALQEHGSRLMPSVPDLGWGSVVGNALERGYGYTAHGEHARFVCGMEVVLPTGEVIRTGMGALPGSETWPLYRGGFGPGFEDLFMQSNLGVVTKMGIWLQPRPEEIAACRIGVPREDQLAELVDAIRELKLEGIVDGVVNAANAVGVAAGMAPRERWFSGEGIVPDHLVDEITEDLGLGRWNIKCSLYGSKAMLDLKLARVREVIGRIPGSRVVANRYPGTAGREEIPPLDHYAAGIPGMILAGGVRWRANNDTGAHIGLCPVSPLTGRHVAEVSGIMRRHIEAAGFDYIGGWLATGRHAVNVLMIFFDGADEAECKKVHDTFAELVPILAAKGYGEYRAHLDFMDLVAEQFSWNDSSLLKMMRTVKSALDPQGILAPGKQGVWPLR